MVQTGAAHTYDLLPIASSKPGGRTSASFIPTCIYLVSTSISPVSSLGDVTNFIRWRDHVVKSGKFFRSNSGESGVEGRVLRRRSV